MFKYKTKSKTILSDLYTPVSAYLRLRDSGVQSALMESNDYHSRDNPARLSEFFRSPLLPSITEKPF